MAYEVLSRPGEKPKAKYEVVSKPKDSERQPGQSLFDTYMRMQNEGYAGMKEGAGRAVAPGASAWERTKGAGQAAMEALGYAASPVSAVARRVLGNPAEVAAGAVGASPGTQTQVGDYAGIIGELLSGAGATKTPQVINAGRQMASEAMPALNRAGNAAGRTALAGIDTVDGLIRSSIDAAQQLGAARTATRAANAAPTREQLGALAQEVNQAAQAAGMNVRPEAFAQFADSVPQQLQAARITSGDIPISNRLYPETIGLSDRLEAYRGHPLTLDNLHVMQQEANGFVREALKAAEGNRGANDVRGATILARRVREFMDNVTPEMVTSGDPQQAAALLNRAKELWRREAKMNTIENIVRTARDLRDPKYLQNEFKALVKDDLEMRNFSAAEAQMIRDIAAGSRVAEVVDAVPGVGSVARMAGKVDKAARGANAGGRINAAQELLDTIARGEGAQTARPSLTDRVADTLGQLRPRVENTQTRRERGGARGNRGR